MTGAALATLLAGHGLAAEEIAAKTALFDLVLSHAALWRAGHHHAWWIPGRLEVFGKHTDYAGGRTLVAAVPRGFAVLATARTDGVVHIVDARRNQEITVQTPSVGTDSGRQTGWRHYADVVIRRLERNFPMASLGAEIVIASDLPRASGMSSSSALLIAIANALVRIGGIDRRAEWQANITGRQDAAGYFACIENGSTFGSLEGDAGVGTHGGSEDHAAILTGAARHLSAFAFVPMRAIGLVRMPEQWAFVLTPSGIPARKAGTAREAYNMLARRTSILCDLWNAQAGAPAPSLAAALSEPAGGAGELSRASSPLAVERLRAIVRRSHVPGSPAEVLEKRLDHFIREDGRISQAIEAFRAADPGRLGALAADSQQDAEALLGNQIPETSGLARAALDLGAFAACSFGAGFGGSLWALIERDRAEAFARRWHPDAFVATPGPPVVELTGPADS
jgi:galactokinase